MVFVIEGNVVNAGFSNPRDGIRIPKLSKGSLGTVVGPCSEKYKGADKAKRVDVNFAREKVSINIRPNRHFKHVAAFATAFAECGRAKKGKTSKEEKDQENQDGDDVLMTEKKQSKKREAPAAESVRIVAAAESVRIIAAHPTFQNGPVAGGGIIKPSKRPRPPLI